MKIFIVLLSLFFISSCTTFQMEQMGMVNKRYQLKVASYGIYCEHIYNRETDNDKVYASKEECLASDEYSQALAEIQKERELAQLFRIFNDEPGEYFFCHQGAPFGDYKLTNDKLFQKEEDCEKDLLVIKNGKHKEKINNFLTKNPKYKQYKKLMLDKKIQMRAPSEVVSQSWGKPQSINKTVHPRYVSEQWVYGGHSYVYMTNGVVSSWQISE